MKTVRILFANFIAFVLLAAAAPSLSAQDFLSLYPGTASEEPEVPEGYRLVDSLVYRFVSTVDSTLVGKDIFHVMPLEGRGDAADVEIYQSQEIANALREQVKGNEDRPISGYRVRIFFDNKQSARRESEETLKKFSSLYRDVKAYMTYVNPYFKVTVGDFRTKSEAMALLSRIKAEFPGAFVVKENIEYPLLDKTNAFVVDTVKVLRPIL